MRTVMQIQLNLGFLLYVCTLHAGITYEFSGGRMGDNLIAYLHAKWIGYKHGLTLLYRPFNYSDKFMLHRFEKQFEGDLDAAALITNENCDALCLTDNNLYRIPYYSDHPFEFNGGYFAHGSSFEINWDDENFKKIARACLAPVTEPARIVVPPKNGISVAMHIRRGGNHEYYGLHMDQRRCPPTSFFAEQLTYVCKKFPGKTIYAFIFTDDLNPGAIAEEIYRSVVAYDVVLDYRPENTSDTSYVLDDFYSIPLFDVLIRSGSNYSYVAGKLGDFLLEISPTECCIDNGKVTVTAVEIIGKEKK